MVKKYIKTAEEGMQSPASILADKLRRLPASERPNTVAVVKTSNGQLFSGQNSDGVINPKVQGALDEIGVNKFQGECAEVNAISEALNNGADLRGATISIANVRGVKSTSGKHGTHKPPCSTCTPLINYFNLTITGQ